jgi:hypothetical protein
VERRRAYESAGKKRTGNVDTGIERSRNLCRRKFANLLSHQSVAQIAIGRESAGGYANDGGMPRQVHWVGDDGRRGVGHRRTVGKDGDRVSDAK